MSRKNIIIMAIVLIVILLIVLTGGRGAKVVDWSRNYDCKGKLPFDTKVFNDQLPSLFPASDIVSLNTNTFYEYYVDNTYEMYDEQAIFMYINQDFDMDISSFEKLLTFVEMGNHVFIAANTFNKRIKNELQFSTHVNYSSENEEYIMSLKSSQDTMHYTPVINVGYTYLKADSIGVGMGMIESNPHNDTLVHHNFIAIPYHSGVFYIHSQPDIFTNHQMLSRKNTTYIDQVISHLPATYQDYTERKYLPVRVYIENPQKFASEIENSPLRFIKSQPALFWAWNILLVSVAIFIAFNIKRKQRIVPKIEPVRNTTVEFVQTVSNLYIESQQYDNIIKNKINYFLADLRLRYKINTDKLDDTFITLLAAKSNNTKEDTEQLIQLIKKLKNKTNSTDVYLIELDKAIGKFQKL